MSAKPLFLFAAISLFSFSAVQAAPEGSVAHRMGLYESSRGGGGYNVTSSQADLGCIYVREGNSFHAMKLRPDGTWHVNRNWTYGERQAQMLRESGNYIDLNDPASRRITMTIDGRRVVLNGDGNRWSEGGGGSSSSGSTSGSSSSGADEEEQDTGTVGGNGSHNGSDPFCRLTGSCGSSSGGGSSTSSGGSSGSGSSSTSSSSSSGSSSGGGQFTPVGELTVSGDVACNGGVRVTSASQAQAAVSGSATCVILASGNYGNLSLNQSSGNVVVKAENLLGAKLSGLSLSGSGITVSGVDIGGGGIRLNGSDLRVSRCMLKGNIGGKMFDATIDRCDISGYTGVLMRLGPPSSGIMFTRNYVHDGGGNGATFHNAPSGVLNPGETNTHREHSMKFIASYNYMERTQGKDFWHAKSSDNVFAFNHVIAMGSQNEISLRHGRNNKLIGNYAPGVKIGVRDYNAVVLGNNGSIRVFGGDINHSFDSMQGKHEGAGYSTQPPARNVRLAGNVGSIEVGTHFESDCNNDPQPAENIEIYDHAGSVRTVGSSCIAWVKNVSNKSGEKAPASWGTIPEPINLSKSDVGPNAN